MEAEPMLGAVGEILLIFLVLSIVFESALTPVFNWRLYREKLGGKGFKTPIVVVLAFVVFWGYDLDIIRDLLVAVEYLEAGAAYTTGGQILTALLIAGGSSGIFNVWKRLGIRAPAPESKPDAPVIPGSPA